MDCRRQDSYHGLLMKSSVRIRRSGPLQRLGYALIASALIVLLLLSSLPGLNLPNVPAYCLAMVAAGGVLVLVHRTLWAVQYFRLKNRTAYCLKCGWYGKGRDMLRIECCPECEAEHDIRLLLQ